MDAAEPFNVPVNPEALGIPVSTIYYKIPLPQNPATLSSLFFSKGQVSQKLERNHHRRNTESTLETKQKESFAGIETARTPSVCWSDTKVSNVIMLSGTRTICSNLEKSDQRVKKNFMKYWTAAGLYYEPSKGTKGVEDAALSGDGKVAKGGQAK
ncbi:hypothetical protein Ahy_A04g018638 [Arachis hypogaea]|uniref:Uncharacterized protein n=1 Tax=Arachis hypogaea TaxID=3818 RepID=A0A445DE58_ARAHY|nr:hypothetical protein Ahy_A04g018638 [Arachis hypogaea]